MEWSRRQLVLSALRAGLGAAAAAQWACATPRRSALPATPAGAPLHTFDASQAVTLRAVMETLLPDAPGIPGARQVNAVGYLDGILAAPRAPPDDLAAIAAGLEPLQRQAHAQHGGAFESLDASAREDVLRVLETDEDGRAWMATLLVYALEALLTDPVYGGNPRGVGWAWLGHQPGLPRPAKPWWNA